MFRSGGRRYGVTPGESFPHGTPLDGTGGWDDFGHQKVYSYYRLTAEEEDLEPFGPDSTFGDISDVNTPMVEEATTV